MLASIYTYPFWYEYSLEPKSSDYHIIFDQTVTELCLANFQKTVKSFITDHVLFNSHLKEKDGILYWKKNQSIDSVQLLDNNTEGISAFINKAFTLDVGPLYRFGIIKLAGNKYRFIIVLHHVLLDGRNRKEFIHTLSKYYNREINTTSLKQQSVSIENFNQKVNQRVLKLKKYDSKAFWLNHIGEIDLTHAICPTNPKNQQHGIGCIQFELPRSLFTQNTAIENYSFHQLLLAVWGVLIAKYSFTNISYIQYPIGIKDANSFIYGAQVNSLITKIYFGEKDTWLNLLNNLKIFIESMRINKDLKHSYLPAHELMMNYRNKNFLVRFSQTKSKSIGCKFNSKSIINSDTHNNTYGATLGLEYEEDQDKFLLRVIYKKNYFDQLFIETLIWQYQELIRKFVQNPEQPISTICVLKPDTHKQIIYDWNQTDKFFPHKTLHELFSKQAHKNPKRSAVIYGNNSINYKTLDEKSEQLARYIETLKPSAIIAILLERSLDMIVAILATLKSGRAYLPLDPTYPKERLKYVLSNSKTTLLLTHSHLPRINIKNLKRVCLDKEDQANSTYWLSSKKTQSSSDLAYVIYTSGTTGLPKGVMVEHRNIIQLVYSNKYKTKRYAFCTNFVFDVSVYEIFDCLLRGGTLYMFPNFTQSDVGHYIQQIKKCKIDSMYIPKFMLPIISQDYTKHYDQYHLKLISIGVEPIKASFIKPFLKHGVVVQNGYGPTETTVCATSFSLKNIQELSKETITLPIGKPLHNVKTYILDEKQTPMPIGYIGELYIGGAGVTRGYLNLNDLTKERFVPNPFMTPRDKKLGFNRLYKTGDLVRYFPDGNIEYIGRNDSQVKLHGYRIELGEIEKILTQYTGIEQCAVLLYNEPISYLAAFYTSKDNNIDELDIKQYLSVRLPDYMTPTIYTHIAQWPLTINGKLDKKSLPTPQFKTRIFVAPRNELETALCRIWKNILGIEQISIHDDFFQLGGQSIYAIQVAHTISRFLNKTIMPKDIFKHKTIAQLYVFLTQNNNLTEISSTNISAPLSEMQSGLFFIEQLNQDKPIYNIPLLFAIKKKVNLIRLKNALQQIVARHEVLHTIFVKNSSGIYYQKPCLELLSIETSSISKHQFNEEVQHEVWRPFDLTKHYPIRAIIYNIKKTDEYFLVVVVHHVAFDEWSYNILCRELQELYDGDLPPLSIQYKDFVVWQNRNFDERTQQGLRHFFDELNDAEPLALPTDYLRPKNFNYQGQNYQHNLTPALSKKLTKMAQQQNTTLYVVLLSACSVLLAKYSGQKKFIIGTVIANRQYHQIENLIGLFTNTIPLHVMLNSNILFSEFLREIQQIVFKAQAYQDIPLSRIINGLNIERNPAFHPLFQIMFSLSYHQTPIKKTILSPINYQDDIAKFDLSLHFSIGKDNINLEINYAKSLFKSDTIQRLCLNLQHFLEELVSADEFIKNYQLLNPSEYKQVVFDYNCTEKNFKITNLPNIFSRQAQRTPKKIALVFERKKISYQELDERSNQLARYIFQNNPSQFIGLYVDRSLDMMIAILGVLKTGCAYVPIEIDTPPERFKYILNDAKCSLVLSTKAIAKKSRLKSILPNPVTLLYIEQNEYLTQSISPLNLNLNHGDLAYVIYTSGTTGLPKGVMIDHAGILNSAYAFNAKMKRLDKNEKILCTYSYIFDVFCLTYALSWLGGHELHILPIEITRDPFLLIEYVSKNNINYIDIPVVLYQAMSRFHIRALKNLKYLICGGQVLSKPIDNMETNYTFVNAYGPTEAGVNSHLAIYEPNKNHLTMNPSCIGQQLANVKSYVLDENQKPVPFGAIGELYLGGAGLALGYLNNPLLTENNFISNPFSTNEDQLNGYTRLYKTGDLVRYQHDDNLEFLNRKDTQVKIRGFRIELTEIEKTIAKFPGIEQSCVIIQGNENPFLVGYYICTKFVNKQLLEEFLISHLPRYMIPTVLQEIDTIPLTDHGKVDHTMLPEPIFKKFEYTSPKDLQEQTICEIWEKNLNVQHIGINDDFFDLGGQSILAIQVVSQINERLKVNLSVADLFLNRTISKICQKLKIDSNSKLLKMCNTNDIVSNISLSYDLSSTVQNNKSIYFIHPAYAGIEVYQNLVKQLNQNICCFGFDNHFLLENQNIININTLSDLASYYIKHLSIAHEATINLCGWSWGGNIAMEMAYQLEQNGYSNIQLYLLDTYILSHTKTNPLSIKKEKISLKEQLKKEGMETKLIQQRINLVSIVAAMHAKHQSKQLKNTKIVLFRATQTNNQDYRSSIIEENHELQQLSKELVYIIPILASHYSIIEHHDEISQFIINHIDPLSLK